MPNDPTTRQLSDQHEAFLAELFDGRRTRGSGNQDRDQLDVRMSAGKLAFAFGFDGKSTRGKTLSVSVEGWRKLVAQAHELRPAMPLRWYFPDNTLRPSLDLVVLDLHHFAELLDAANGLED